jgi:hypothetical protein
MAQQLVAIAYEDLVSGKDVTEQIFKAYGPGGLGALTISGIPQYPELRTKLLPLGKLFFCVAIICVLSCL